MFLERYGGDGCDCDDERMMALMFVAMAMRMKNDFAIMIVLLLLMLTMMKTMTMMTLMTMKT